MSVFGAGEDCSGDGGYGCRLGWAALWAVAAAYGMAVQRFSPVPRSKA